MIMTMAMTTVVVILVIITIIIIVDVISFVYIIDSPMVFLAVDHPCFPINVWDQQNQIIKIIKIIQPDGDVNSAPTTSR